MPSIFQNFIAGTIDNNPLAVGGTSLSSPELADLQAVSSPSTMYLVLDPEAEDGDPEIVTVTTHTAAATTATITRGQQSTTAREHASGTVWRAVFTKSDADELPFRKMTTTGDILYASAANTASRLAIGSANGMVLTVASGVPSWGLFPAVALRGTTQSINDNTLTSLVLGTEDLDSDGFHSSSDGSFTVPSGLGGFYMVTAGVSWAADADGYRELRLTLSNNNTNGEGNNSYRQGGHAMVSTNNSGNSLSKLMKLEAGATVAAQVTHTAGAALDVTISYLTAVLVRWVPSLT